MIPTPPSMLAHPSNPAALLQDRVAKFGLYAGFVGCLAVIFNVVAGARLGLPVFGPIVVAHGLAACAPLVVWAITRRATHTERFLRSAEATAVVATCWGYAVMGYGIEQAIARTPMRGSPTSQLIVLMAMSLVTFSRTVVVPSSPRCTFWVTVLASGGLLVLASPLGSDARVDTFGSPRLPHVGTMLGAAMWWSLVTLLATLAAGVTSELRHEASMAKQYGQYTLVDKIGEGGMGVVYRAQHRLLRRPTAVKLLPSERAGARAITRFEREVQLTAQLSHPNTVTIFDYGRTPEGIFYYAMELLDGETLQDIVEATGPMPVRRAAHVLVQVAGALSEAHARGLIHRDIKPANIMLCTQGGMHDVAKVLDFGLVQDLNLDASNGGAKDIAVGTPQYLAPETLSSSASMSTAADIYAFGAIAYWLLTGQPVYDGHTIVEVCTMHAHAPVPSVASRSPEPLPADLDALITACLAKVPHERPTAREVIERLRACPPEPWSETNASRWWDEHRQRVRSRRRSFQPQAVSATLAIDLARR